MKKMFILFLLMLLAIGTAFASPVVFPFLSILEVLLLLLYAIPYFLILPVIFDKVNGIIEKRISGRVSSTLLESLIFLILAKLLSVVLGASKLLLIISLICCTWQVYKMKKDKIRTVVFFILTLFVLLYLIFMNFIPTPPFY